MSPGRLGVVACLTVFALCPPQVGRGQDCLPPFTRTQSGWLIKYFANFPSDKLFRTHSACPEVITTSGLHALSQQACDVWLQACWYPFQLAFTYQDVSAYPSDLVSSVVLFANNSDYRDHGGLPDALATAIPKPDPANGNILRNRILIDGSYDFEPSCPNNECEDISLLGVLVHEWGHALGLGDLPVECRFQSVMAPVGMPGSNWQETLYWPDQYRINSLYAGYPVSAGLDFWAHPGPTADTLFWSETTPRACWYNISVSDACWGPFVDVGRTIGVTAIDHYSMVVPAQFNRTYWYRLTVEQEGAIVDSAAASSDRTEGQTVEVPGTPVGVNADGTGPGGVALSWQPAGGTVDGYYVYRGGLSLDACGQQNAVFGPVTGTTLVDSTAYPGVPYAYRVRAFNSTASSGISDQATAQVTATVSKSDTLVVACPQGDAGRIAFSAELLLR